MIKSYQDFKGGLNLTQSSDIKDNEFKVLKNMGYNLEQQVQTRRGFRKFGNQIGANPISSYFFFQRDDNGERLAVCSSGGSMYSYDGTTWNSIATDLMEYETIPGRENNRTRWDFAVYKNIIYMCDGVNPYSKYDGTTFSQIGLLPVQTITFDNTTNQVNWVGSGLNNNDEIIFTDNGTLPTEIRAFQVYYVIVVDADNFQITNTVDGDPIDFTDDGSGTNQLRISTEPRCRYLQYLQNTMFGGGDDANPITLYYTNSLPSDADNINQNVVVIGGDEQGKINGISEYSEVILIFKDSKIYGVNLAGPSADPIDTQTGGFADRSISSVGNSMVYFNERGIDTLQKRSGVDGTGAIEGKPLSDNVRELLKRITEKEYNSGCGWYIKKLNNYYFAFDSNNDNIPDTRLVYNSQVSAWSQYIMPPTYDFGLYINENKEYQNLFASASGGQMYQFEYGFDDDGSPINTELETKDFDFDDPAQEKVFSFVDVTGYKQEGGEISLITKVNDEVVSEGQITDNNIDLGTKSGILSVDPIGVEVLSASEGDSQAEMPMYKFTVRIPFYNRGTHISVAMKASGVQRILEKMRIEVNGEVVPVFSYGNIL